MLVFVRFLLFFKFNWKQLKLIEPDYKPSFSFNITLDLMRLLRFLRFASFIKQNHEKLKLKSNVQKRILGYVYAHQNIFLELLKSELG